MAITNRMAFFDLRDWWMSNSEFRSNLEILESDPAPFFPISEPPETKPPFILYESHKFIDGTNWWMHYEKIYLKIVSYDVLKIFGAMNIMIDMASQGAYSARDLDYWMKTNNKTIDFYYHSIQYVGTKSQSAPTERGGAIEYDLGFIIDYSPKEGRLIKPED